MIKAQLREYVEQVIEAKEITAQDVRVLLRDVLADGLTSRHEAETLLALDRSLKADPAWTEAVKALLVDFVVWGSRPTGYVTADDARWLAAALDVGLPTQTGLAVARAIIDEAEQVDEALFTFLLSGRQTANTLAA